MQDLNNYKINSVLMRNIPVFTTGGKSVQVTRVSIKVGEHGPFVQDFGPTTGRDATPEAINAWKQQQVATVMAVDAQ